MQRGICQLSRYACENPDLQKNPNAKDTYTKGLTDMRIEYIDLNGLAVTPDFVDCDCEDDYIHPASGLREYDVVCNRCGTFVDDAPNSHVTEVRALLQGRV